MAHFQMSLTSATSFESRCGPQIFASTGYFRGNLVRIKEIKFSKKKDINREIMKEMRLLRDIRHDNVNSFIGAVLEPMRILVVTDYCSKGSLYVSVTSHMVARRVAISCNVRNNRNLCIPGYNRK